MTTRDEPEQNKEIQLPEWEHGAAAAKGRKGNNANRPRKSAGASFATKFDSVLPPNRKYVGLSRRVFLIVLLALFIALLVLIIGLAVGLNGGSR